MENDHFMIILCVIYFQNQLNVLTPNISISAIELATLKYLTS